jgi:transposase InsO family protein
VSEEQWVEHQQLDEYCQPFLVILSTSDVKQLCDPGTESSDYFFRPQVENKVGALCRRTIKIMKDSHEFTTVTVTQEIFQKVIPKILKQTCLLLFHDQLGPPGKERTISTIRLNYYWPNMHTDIQKYVHDCNFCKKRKAHNFRAKVPVQEYFRMSRPMDRMHADLAGPFPVTERENKYVLLIKDALTKFLIVIALPDKTADVVLQRFVTDVFAHYGTPRLLITDRGTDFVNAQMKEWCRITQIKKVHTTPANPRSDGLAENQVRTTKDMLASYINDYQNDWDRFLPVIQFNYNTTVNMATGYTPYFLMFGRQANRADQPEVETSNKKDLNEYIQSFNNVMTNVWADTSHQILRNSKTMLQKQHPRDHLQYKEYKIGEFFFARRVPRRFYKNPFNEKVYKLNAKLQNRWTGPFIITKVISPVVYEADIHNTKKMVHAVNMRPY